MVQNIWVFFTSKYIFNQEKVTSKKKIHLPTIVWLSITQKYVSSYLERKIGSCLRYDVSTQAFSSVTTETSVLFSKSSSSSSTNSLALEQALPQHWPQAIEHFMLCFLQLHLALEQSPLQLHLIIFRCQWLVSKDGDQA